MESHFRLHTLEKPHNCVYCNQGFSSKGGLQLSQRNTKEGSKLKTIYKNNGTFVESLFFI